jgi:branched-chain amino acid transport system substrate-binding protein
MNRIQDRAARCALLAALALSAGAAPAQSPVKIGFVGELSGPQAAVGQDQYDGFMLAVERNNGKLGGVPVEILKEDTQLKPDVANQAVRKLVEKDGVSIITGVSFSNIMLAIHKYVTDKEVFLIGSNAGPSQIAGSQCSPYQFITSWQGDQAAEAVGKYMNEKGFKKIVTLAPSYQAGKDIIAGIKRQYRGEILDELYTPLTQLDFSAVLTQAAAARPDAIFAFYPGGLGIGFVKQYQQAGLAKKTPLASAFIVDATTLPALRDAAEGVISGGFWAPDFQNASSKQFVADFEKKYSRLPSNYAAQSYDAALLLDSALAKMKGNVADKKAFGAALKAADFASVRGTFKFNNNNFPIQDMHVMEVVKDGTGRHTLKTIATPLKATEDAYHALCPLK